MSTNIFTSQDNLFSSFMNDWWDPDGPVTMLHSFHPVRTHFICNGFLQSSTEYEELNPLKDKHILDVGCGGGILSEELAKLGAKVTGIDVSEELINVAKVHADMNLTDNKPTYQHISIEDHAKIFKNYYDGVIASEVIEHVENPQSLVQSCVETLKPGGKIFITTPNRSFLSRFVVIFLFENFFECMPKGAHQYEKFIRPNELASMLEQNNCHVESLRGTVYNPFNKTWSFSYNQQLFYVMQGQKHK